MMSAFGGGSTSESLQAEKLSVRINIAVSERRFLNYVCLMPVKSPGSKKISPLLVGLCPPCPTSDRPHRLSPFQAVRHNKHLRAGTNPLLRGPKVSHDGGGREGGRRRLIGQAIQGLPHRAFCPPPPPAPAPQIYPPIRFIPETPGRKGNGGGRAGSPPGRGGGGGRAD